MVTTQWMMIVVVSILSGLDRTALAQTMLSRPLVCSCIAGYVLGIFVPALQIGIMLELLWLMRLPVGATIAPDDTQAAIGAVVLVKLFGPQITDHLYAYIILIVVLVVILAEVGKCWDVWARHLNERLFSNALRGLERSKVRPLVVNHYAGLIVFSCAALLSLLFIVAGGSAALWAGVKYMPPMLSLFPVHAEGLVSIFPLVGIASILVVLHVKHTASLFIGGFFLTFMLLEVL